MRRKEKEKMKATTKTDALNKLLRIDETKKANERAKTRAMNEIKMRSTAPEEVAKRAVEAHAAQCSEYKADEDFRALPKPRRDWAKEAKKWAEDQARLGLDLGGDYSGDTSQSIRWGDCSLARTATCYGDKYSRSCKFSKTDAEHIVQLCVDDVVRLDGWRPIAERSAIEGLPVIGKQNDGRFVWIKAGKGKSIESESGWIGCVDGTIYHSKKSAEDAQAGAKRKAKRVERERWEAKNARVIERRARLVSRLCGGITATIADARAMGYCEPGIESFQAKHGIGDSASLPALVRTGNRDAIRLALKLARRVSVKVQKQATA
jgi:hypothetical protein